MKISELLAKPEAWTQKMFAKDARGNYADTLANTAVCWCLMGAALKCYRKDDRRYRRVLKQLRDVLGHVARWNDAPERTHEEVLALVTRLGV